MRPRCYWFISLGITITTLACALSANLIPGPATPPPGPVGTGAALVQPQSTVPPAKQFPVPLTSAHHGLDRLQSYRAHLLVEFTGQRGGQPVSGTLESLTELTRQPAALHQYLKATGTISQTQIPPGISEFFRINDQVFVKKGEEGEWFRFTDAAMTPDRLNFFQPDHLILLPAAVVIPPNPDSLNGQEVSRFVFTETDLSDPNIDFERVRGDFRLAQAGNYLVQYTLSASLRIIIPDPKAYLLDEGQVSLSYTLSDVDRSLAFAPPPEAVTGGSSFNDLPRLPEAEISAIFPTFIEYTSPTTAISATLYYQDQLLEQGWTEESVIVFTEKAQLLYSRPGEQLTILITPAEDPRKIKVLLDLGRR